MVIAERVCHDDDVDKNGEAQSVPLNITKSFDRVWNASFPARAENLLVLQAHVWADTIVPIKFWTVIRLPHILLTSVFLRCFNLHSRLPDDISSNLGVYSDDATIYPFLYIKTDTLNMAVDVQYEFKTVLNYGKIKHS